MFARLLKLDWILIITILLLNGVGLLAIYSLTVNDTQEGLNIFWRQMIFLGVGFFLMIIFTFFDYRYLKLYTTPIYLATLVALAAVLIIGVKIRGTVGWIGIGSFHIQPVEAAKLTLIIFLAGFVSQKKYELTMLTRLIASFVLTGFMLYLILRQPDLGSALILAGIWGVVIIVAGLKWRYLFSIAIVAVLVVVISWSFLADYQKLRIITTFDPQRDAQGIGYNVIQSMTAVGSGGLIGKGIGHGSQSQLNFLPEKHTDFIFAVIAEESGFVGSLFVLGLYLVIFQRFKKVAEDTDDNFAYFIVVGVMAMFFWQILVNVGMNLGLAPVIGIPLPFLSYGGSSLVSSFAGIGILLSIYSRRKEKLEIKITDSY